MTTDTDHAREDRLPVPHFTARLWEELAELHDQRRSRHRGRRSLGAGAGIAAVAAATVAVVVARSPGPAPEEEPELGDLVVAAAARIEETTVLHAVTDVIVPDPALGERAGYDTEQWTDWASPSVPTRSLVRDQAGNLLYESGGPWTSEVDGAQRRIDHVARTYQDLCGGGYSVYAGGEMWAEVMREQLATGRYVEDGTEVVDGRELIVVRTGGPGEGDGDGAGGRPARSSKIYVDPDTHLMVLDRSYDAEGRLISEVTFEHLPRTPENLAQAARPAAPAGYRPVDTGDGGCEPAPDDGG